jgi:hypothetical protein
MRQGDQQTACERVLQPRNATQCRNALTQYCVPEQPPVPTPPACEMLGRCCTSLTDSSDRADCDLVASAAEARVCEVAAPNFCPPSVECTMLDQCCRTVDDESDRRDCEQVLAAQDPVVCNAATIAYCSSVRPPEPPVACTMLTPCCARITNAGERTACEQVVQRADRAACEDAADQYCAPTPPAACMRLQTCCADVQNSGDRQVCERTAQSQNMQQCENDANRFCMNEPAPDAGDSNACEMLGTCCAALLNVFERIDCDAIVQQQNEDNCGGGVDTYCN